MPVGLRSVTRYPVSWPAYNANSVAGVAAVDEAGLPFDQARRFAGAGLFAALAWLPRRLRRNRPDALPVPGEDEAEQLELGVMSALLAWKKA